MAGWDDNIFANMPPKPVFRQRPLNAQDIVARGGTGLRNLAAANGGAGWHDRLQQALKTGVIPASIGGVTLYPTAGLPATPSQGAPPGTSLNSHPDWWKFYGGGL